MSTLPGLDTGKAAVCSCGRCERPCRVDGPGNPDAQIFRKSAVPSGYCVDCVATEFLLNSYPVNMDLDEKGPESLRNPQLQQLFGDLMRTAMADASLDEINWDRVIANWDLPVMIAKNNPQNPYMPVHPRRAGPDERYEPHCNAWDRPKPRGEREKKSPKRRKPRGKASSGDGELPL